MAGNIINSFREFNCYRYFDTPDGKDVIKKIWFVDKHAMIVANGFALWEILLLSHPIGTDNIIKRYAYLFFPVMAIPTVFVAVANYSAQVRNKDDELNWVAGGLAASTVPLVWKRKLGKFLLFATIGTAGGAICKYYFKNNKPFKIFPTKGRQTGDGVWFPKTNFTLTRDIPGDYEVGPCTRGRGISKKALAQREKELEAARRAKKECNK